MFNRISTLFALVLISATAVAQDASFKPAKGDIAVEGTIQSIFGDNFGIDAGSQGNQIFGLRGRYFINDQLAGRATLGLNFNSNGNFGISGANGTLNGTLSSSTFGIALGIEKHFTGTKRLSPYVGGDLLFSTFSENWEINNNPAAPGTPVVAPTDRVSSKNIFGNSRTSFGIQGVIGADYYVAERVFLGVEFGLQFLLTSFRNREETLQNGNSIINGVNVTTGGTAPPKPESNSNFNTSYVTSLRFGFVL